MVARLALQWPRLVNWLNGGFISIYKIAGFAILSAIVLGMSAYLLTSGFYLLSSSWTVPSILTPGSDKVISARAEYLAQLDQLSRQEAEREDQRRELELAKGDRERYAAYAATLAASVPYEIKKFEAELNGIRKTLARNPGSEHKKVGIDGQTQIDQLRRQYQSQLITREQYAKAMIDADRVAKSQYANGQFVPDMGQRAQALTSIIAVSRQPAVDGELLSRFVAAVFATGDLGLIDRYQLYLTTNNRQEELSAREKQIQTRLATLESGITQLRASLQLAEKTPAIRASEQIIYTAFVPYQNLKNVAAGRGVYGCYLHFFACRKVGEVASQFPSEVLGRHPMSGRELRGQVIELNMTLPKWAEAGTLFVGRPPLFL